MTQRPSSRPLCCGVFILGLFLFYSCGPIPETTYMYKTPAVYFAPPQVVPMADSSRLHAGADVGTGVGLNFWGYYRFKNNIIAGLGYGHNAGIKTRGDDYSNLINYKNESRMNEIYGGYLLNRSGHFSYHVTAGYGGGSSTSIVPEYNQSTNYSYGGKFTKWFGTVGVTGHTSPNRKKAAAFSLGLRGSNINFSNYSVNGDNYSDVQDFLFDFSFNVAVMAQFLTFRFSANAHLNGYDPGDRQVDMRVREWRRQATNISVGIGFRLVKE